MIVSGGGAASIVNVSDCCTDCDALSCNVNVYESLLAALGIPVIAPVDASSCRSAGSDGATDHVRGGVPPDPCSWAL